MFDLLNSQRRPGRRRVVEEDAAKEKGPPVLDPMKALVTEVTDRIFFTAKMRLQCPSRWRALFIAAAKRSEKRMDHMREDMFVAASLDDVDALRRLQPEVPPLLWKWWSYDLDIVSRATARGRHEQLRLLPEFFGTAFKSAAVVAAARAAIEAHPYRGSAEAVRDSQRSDVLSAVPLKAIEKGGEIAIEELRELLDSKASGLWRESLKPAHGVNFGAEGGRYAGWTPLHFVAAASGAKGTAAEAANMLLDARSDPMLADAAGCTALHIAAANNNMPVVEVLLHRGAPVEKMDNSGCTALMVAAKSRFAEVVRHIAKWAMPHDASVHLLNAEAELTAQRYNVLKGVELHRQVGLGDRDRIKQLVLVGDGRGADLADVNFADSLGRSPLHTAATMVSDDERAGDMVRALVALRANVDVIDLDGQTPLHIGARVGRAPVVRALLRMKAHPIVTDREGRTPLMWAAEKPGLVREPPEYDGVLPNPAESVKSWKTVESILTWNGKGTPPGPPRRQAKNAPLIVENKKATVTPGEIVRLRAEVLAEWGFDDQFIIDSTGRINRGDRIQLYKVLSRASAQLERTRRPDGTAEPAEGAFRARLLWENMTGPLLRMQVQGTLSPRLGEFLHYLLLSLLGRKGPAFGLLIASCIGTREAVMPEWKDVRKAVEDADDFEERLAAVKRIGFRGPAPKKAVWVGAVWEKDDYPRDPRAIPWGALEYVDQDTAVRLKQGANSKIVLNATVVVRKPFKTDNDTPVLLKIGDRGRVREVDSMGDAVVKFESYDTGQLVFSESFENLQVIVPVVDEAFKGNDMPPFEPFEETDLPATGARPRTFRGEQLQLVNRLFVDEALGVRCPVEDRVRLIGEQLLCPLLEEAARGFKLMGEEFEEIEKQRPMLRYFATQMDIMDAIGEEGAQDCEPTTVEAWDQRHKRWAARRNPFKKAWVEARAAVAHQLLLGWQVPSSLANLTPCADVVLSATGATTRAPPTIPEQSSVLPAAMVSWLQARHSAQIFIQLRQVDAVACADDFNTLATRMGAVSPKDFPEHFWRGMFYLLLWGRANQLRPHLFTELRRRLPDGTQIIGPTVRPRNDYSAEMDRKAREDACRRRREDAQWTAWETSEFKRRSSVGLLGPAAKKAREAAKKINPHVARHMTTWKNVAYTGALAKPGGDSSVASGGGPSAVRMLQTKPPVAVDRSLAESRAATGADGLPTGLTDVLRAEVMCDTPEAMVAAFAALIQPPPPPARPTREEIAEAEQKGTSGRGHIVSFRVLRVVNDFHREQEQVALPRTSGVVLLACFSVCARGVGSIPVQQLVEVELVLPWTSEARWLAGHLRLDPVEARDALALGLEEESCFGSEDGSDEDSS